MAFAINLSLQHICMVKIAAELWNKRYIKTKIAEFEHPYDYYAEDLREQWVDLEDTTLGRVSALPLPTEIKKTIKIFIKPIGLEIRKWWDYHHDEQDYMVLELPETFFWTPQGTVDYKKTAEAFVKNENLDVERRLNLAFMSCLEKDIRSLWARISDDRKLQISQEIKELSEERIREFEKNYVIREVNHIPDLVDFWACIMGNDQAVLKNVLRRRDMQDYSPVKFAFDCAVSSGNRAASAYFLAKLSGDEKEDVLMSYFPRVLRLPNCNVDVVCFLLNQMSGAQREEVLRPRMEQVLTLLLNWSWQRLFEETTRRWWHLISEEDYLHVLKETTSKIRSGCDDYDYGGLFRDFWLRGSAVYKQFVLRSNDVVWIGIGLLNAVPKRSELAKLMFENVTTLNIKILISAVEGINSLAPFFHQEKQSFLNFFTEEKFVTEKEINAFK